MTKIEAAVTREQGIEFTVVSVRPSAVATTGESERVIRGLLRYFPDRPIVLAAEVGGRIKFVGRPDIVRWLANVPVHLLPWRTYRFND